MKDKAMKKKTFSAFMLYNIKKKAAKTYYTNFYFVITRSLDLLKKITKAMRMQNIRKGSI